MNLGEMKVGQRGRISRVDSSQAISQRLLEIGLVEGADCEVIHEAPLSHDPIAVRVRGSIIALRRAEAALIEVTV